MGFFDRMGNREKCDILNLNKYLKPGKNKKLKKIVDNMANKNVKGVVSAWK